MKKFKCEECINPCILNIRVDYVKLPKMCPYDNPNPDWHEVEEFADWKEVKENKEIKAGESERLPDWCKVGEWLYLSDIDKYTKILACDDLSAIHSLWKRGRAFPAHKRPFNADEMKALVGKVVKCVYCVQFITAYYKEENKVYFDNGWRDAEYLLINDFTIDDKPCCKFEHLENGEWVE